MNPGDIDPRARAFGGVAEAYERARPSYPRAAVDLIVAEFGLGPGRVVLDVGAGTGKWTRLLAGSGAEVVAVEPVDEMRAVLSRATSGVRVLAGTAESLPLGNASVDIVTAAQAFHWFDPERAVAEVARVLRPGGGVALVWNSKDSTRWPWTEIGPIFDRHAGDAPRFRGADGRWEAAFAADGRFGPMRLDAFPYVQALAVPRVVERVASTSYIAALDDDTRALVLAEVEALFAGHDGPVTLPYVTEVYRLDR